MRSRVRSGIVTAAGAVASIIIAISVNFATGSSLSQWSDTASIVAAVAAAVGLLGAVAATFYAEHATNAEAQAGNAQEQLGFKLIRIFATMEKEASLQYQRQSHTASSRPLSLREVRAIMADSGVWDDQDQLGFDLATRTRNAIVHGDLDQVDPLDLQYATEKAEQLLKKIQEAETTRWPTE